MPYDQRGIEEGAGITGGVPPTPAPETPETDVPEEGLEEEIVAEVRKALDVADPAISREEKINLVIDQLQGLKEGEELGGLGGETLDLGPEEEV